MPEAFLILYYLFSNITVTDMIDMLLVAVVLFVLFQAMQRTRALQLLRGVVIIIVLSAALLLILPLNTFEYLVIGFLITGIIALPLLFQDELRRALTGLGQIGRRKVYGTTFDRFKKTIITTIDQLSSRQEGALIVLEGQTLLTEFVETGTPIHAENLTSELLTSIFSVKSPLHDGAVILRGDSLLAAGCILPVYTKDIGALHMGTRHRAALGLTNQISDALAIVVSEETGRISIAIAGRIYRDLSLRRIEKWLDRFRDQLAGEETSRLKWLLGTSWKSTLLNLVMAVGLAVIGWMAVALTINPPQQKTIENVALVVNEPSGKFVQASDVPEGIDVQVRTFKNQTEDIDASIVQAEIDLEKLETGIHPVLVNVTSLDDRIQVESWNPEEITVIIEPIIQKTITPTLTIEDPESLPLGFVMGDVTVEPGAILVEGRESLMEKLVEARAILSIDGKLEDFNQTVPLRLLDENGSVIEGLESDIDKLEVFVPIRQESLTRTVAIQPDVLEDTLEEGYEISAVRVLPTSTTLTGSRAALENAGDFIVTTPISITNVFNEMIMDVPLIRPDGVISLNEQGEVLTSVVVEVSVEPETDYLLLTTEPVLRGVDPNLSAQFEPDEITILLIGPKNLLLNIEQNTDLVIVYADLSEKPAGVHTIPLEMEVPRGLEVDLFPSEIQVVLTEQPQEE